MAIPLKTGADFYNNEALRLVLHHLSVDATSESGLAAVTGLIYYNSSSGNTYSNRIRYCYGFSGSTPLFHSLATMKDLDDLNAASQEDLTELSGRIGTLEEMLNTQDAEGVVNTWREIQAFLDSVQEGVDLMTLLNDKVDNERQVIAGTGLAGGGTLASDVTLSLAPIGNGGTYFKTTIDAYGRVILGVNPNTLEGFGIQDAYTKIEVNALNGVTRSIAESALAKNSFDRIYAGAIDSDVVSAVTMYADTFTGNATSATKLQTARTIWGQSFDGTGIVRGDIALGANAIGYSLSEIWTDENNNTHPWYGINYKHLDTGVYSLTISNWFGLTLKTGRGNLCMTIEGDVGIGTTSPSYKLDVSGTGRFTGAVTLDSTLAIAGTSTFNGGAYIPTGQTIRFGPSGPTMEYDSASGAIKVTGDLYATGQISAGGVAEEGGTGGGNGRVVSVPIAKNASENSFDVYHGLATEDVIVNLYEINANTGLAEMVLTDVTIKNENYVTITFGTPPSDVAHKVVIMG